MQDIIENVLIQTSPTTNPKLQILKTHFPECFDKEGKLLVDKLEKSLMGGGGGVEFSKESYSLNWLGKSYASVLRNDPAKTWIKPDKAFNSTHSNSQNFLIKGDNLEALKLLKNAYEKKIKMIYIDPPYNTGNNDFVYKDDRKYTPKELSTLCGMSEEDCKKMLEYYSKGKNSHSAWLTFMYPRLSLARNLLKEDGVIFISIDDNEQANLKILCDEIFGEENFVNTFFWLHGKGKKDKNSRTLQQYCLCYAKDRTKLESWTIIRHMSGETSNPDNDERGEWLSGSISFNEARSNPKHKNYYSITSPSGVVWTRQWMCSRNEMNEYLKQGKIWFGNAPTYDAVPRIKIFQCEASEVIPDNIFGKHGTSKSAKNELKKLFEVEDIFDTPKPTELIKAIIDLCCGKNDTILDFFAGSGTTAQAVMELNAEDGGNRRFILVQLPESIDEKKSKTAYDFVKNTLGKDEPKISDITQERIIRASKQIKEKHPEYQGDLGFKVFELEEIPSELAEIKQSNFEKITHLFANEDIDKMLDIEAILQSFCLYDSIPLGAELEKVDLGGYIAYKFQERIYLLHQGFQTKHLQEFLRKMDDEESFCVGEIVLLAYCFESARRREIAEAISYYNKKSRELKIVVRG